MFMFIVDLSSDFSDYNPFESPPHFVSIKCHIQPICLININVKHNIINRKKINFIKQYLLIEETHSSITTNIF